MATGLAQKLRLVQEGMRVAAVNAPRPYAELVDLPAGTTVSAELDGTFDIVHAFIKYRRELEPLISALAEAMGDDGILWISYPKQSAKTDADLNRDSLAQLLMENSLKPVTQISVDDVWSALRFKKV